MFTNTISAVALGLLSSLVVPTDAYWRMPCGGTLVAGRLDPVVTPGKVSGHTHSVMGGNGFGPTMDYADTQASTCTSCAIDGDFSNYWTPMLYYRNSTNGEFTSVGIAGGAGGTVYYQQRVSYPGKKLQAFPAGFRMTAGNPELRAYNATVQQEAISYACLNYNGGGPPQQSNFFDVNCPDGVRAQVYFPSCWDGVNLDSPDHQSHMAYPLGGRPDGGVCPDDHPVPMISIFYEMLYDTGKFANDWYDGKQPFVWSMGDNTGYGFHGDFVNGWNVELLQNAVDNFVTEDAGQADNVYSFAPFKAPAISGTACSLPPMVNEQVVGTMDQLPGCNPVTSTPGPVTDCTATTTLGTVTSGIYTDMTAEGWEYLGCGIDVYGNPALGMPLQDAPTMTVQNCITLCGGKGFSIAGLEYASQCFCGDSLPARASPTPGSIGTCNMPCAGNSSELCGAGSRLSLYQKCGSTCQNAQFNGPNSEGSSAAPATVLTASATAAVATPTPSMSSNSSAPVAAVVSSSSAVLPAYESPVPVASSSAAVHSVAPSSTSAATSSEESDCPASSTDGPSAPTPTSSASSGNSSVVLPSGWTSAGCYLDTVNPRSLSGLTYAWWGEKMTSSGCAAYCADKGFSYAGTENGGQCFCGNELVGSQVEPASDCSLPCDGSASEVCGGQARLSVFTSSTTIANNRRRSHLRRHAKGYQGAHYHEASV